MVLFGVKEGEEEKTSGELHRLATFGQCKCTSCFFTTSTRVSPRGRAFNWPARHDIFLNDHKPLNNFCYCKLVQ